MKNMLKILGIAQRGTESGLTRIGELIEDSVEFIYLKDFKKVDFENGRLNKHKPFDGILSQCITHCPLGYRGKTVLFGLGSCNRKILYKKTLRDHVLDNPFREVWVNNNTISKALKEVGLATKVMYRANDIRIPDVCPPKPKNRFIVWYANPWNGCLQPYKKLAQSVIKKLGNEGIRVFMIPHKSGWSRGSHVCALGKTDLGEIFPCVQGMVRFGGLGDFGRINYDFVAQGKWVLNYDVDEPFMESVPPVPKVHNIVKQIVDLVDSDTEENRVDRWSFAKRHLSTDAMKENWSKEVIRAFS